jgi:signal transduction histidine kinase
MPPLQDIPRAAWLAGLAVVAAHLIVTVADVVGAYGSWFQLAELPLRALTAGIWAAVAILAVSNAVTRRFGWLVVVAAWAQIWIIAAIPGDVFWSASWAVGGIGAGVIVHLQIAYPTGRLRSRSDRVVVIGGYVLFGVLPLVRMPFWDSVADFDPCDAARFYCPRNLFLVVRDDALVATLDWLAIVLMVAISVAIVGALWAHGRAVSAAARRAYVPVLIAAVINGVLLVVERLAHELRLTDLIAVMGSHALSLAWNAVPVGFLLGLLAGRLARQRVAVLAMDLAAGVPTGGLRPLLARALQDPTVELLFPDPSGDGFVDVEGRAVVPPTADGTQRIARLERDGDLLALLVHDRAVDDADPELVPAVGSVARMALVNERLAAQVRAQLEEVRASRERVVRAADAERARIEHDLHDGAQRRLEDLTLRLEAAQATSATAADLIARTTEELRTAIDEVRGLAAGLRPALLTEAGLGAAVRALAAGTPVPVEVDVPEARYAADLEATAYFVVAEALTNVARYAGASGVRVEVRESNGAVTIRITDDGRGGADPAHGSGLRGLLDRVAAAGGSLVVDSPPGVGTSLTATFPVA